MVEEDNMHIAICDDEPVYINILKKKIESEFRIQQEKCDIYTVNSGEELLKLCEKCKIDVVFLDIMMPAFDGFDIAHRLRQSKKDIMIVFVSNKETNVFLSYEYNPIWFVPKDQLHLMEKVVKKIIQKKLINDKYSSFKQLKLGNQVLELELDKIKYFRSNGHYINYTTSNGVISESYRCQLDDIEQQLINTYFIRSHNRYLANLQQVNTISNNKVIFYDKEEIPVSKAQMSKVKEQFQDYLRSLR